MNEIINLKARVWPVDVAELKQGDTIDARHMIPVPPEHRDYNFRLLRIKGLIERKLRAAAISLYLRIDGESLRVMTDPELAEYERRAAFQGFRRLRTASVRLGDVDRAALTDEEREAHDKAHMRIRRIEHAASVASRQRKIPPIQTSRSMLPKPEAES